MRKLSFDGIALTTPSWVLLTLLAAKQIGRTGRAREPGEYRWHRFEPGRWEGTYICKLRMLDQAGRDLMFFLYQENLELVKQRNVCSTGSTQVVGNVWVS